MLSLIGQVSLIIALFFSLLQSIFPLIGYFRKYPSFLAMARPAALGQVFFVTIAYFIMSAAFIIHDKTIDYVVSNSNVMLPFLYRLTAVWGAHEGSILLWVFMVGIWTILFIVKQKDSSSLPLSLSILGSISFCFLCFLLLTSNPFLPTVTEISSDLNPLLQDIGFIIHPPFLYLGYIGFSVVFSIAQTVLIRGDCTGEWIPLARYFTIMSWMLLTMGILLGSWWSYHVLGWGGFWFWDPVENVSLLPWLTGLALIHVLIVAEKKKVAKCWAVLLAILCFLFSMLGTFLVRSGLFVSVHAFASDPVRGIFLLGLFTFFSVVTLIIYAVRMKRIESAQFAFNWCSREASLLVSSVLLFSAMVSILFAIVYPLAIDALGMGTLSVGEPYFKVVMTPFVFIILFFMIFASFCRWQQQSFLVLCQKIWKPVIVGLAVSIFLFFQMIDEFSLMKWMLLSAAISVVISALSTFNLVKSMSIAHIGFSILIIGITLSACLSMERAVYLKPGEAIMLGSYQFYFHGLEGIHGANYRGVQANFIVKKHQHYLSTLHPQKRIYLFRKMIITRPAIETGFFRDLVISLGEPRNTHDWSVRFYYKPFICLIWIGGILMAIGGLLSIMNRARVE